MADFRIQRFKHTWKGAWEEGITYNSDDVVSVSGKVYNCLVRHTSDTNFYLDLNFLNSDSPPVPTPRWELIADGVSFRNNWQSETEYFIGDIVKNNATIYICLENHVSSSSIAGFFIDYLDENYWTIFFESIEWKDDWQTTTFFQPGDVVRYSGSVYKCIQAHFSSSSLEIGLIADADKWEIFTSGNSWVQDWEPEKLYFINDITRYGGIIYKCVNQHTSGTLVQGLESILSNWEIIVEGVEFKGSWQDGERYKTSDIVRYGPYLYKAITGHTVPVDGAFDNVLWEIYCPGQEFQNIWDPNNLYRPGEAVRHGGYIFVSNTSNINSEPDYDFQPTNPDWDILFAGTRIRGGWNSTSTYDTGDIVRRGGQLYVAKKNVPADQDTDIIGDGSSINSEYWDLLIPGVFWRGAWTIRRTYVIGDVVTWRGASFKCIVKHFSSDLDRPDSNQGNVWEQYTYGDPENQLSFIGDIKYFGIKEDGSTIGTTRLPIGDDGQTLRSTDSSPVWENFNGAAKVFFVSLEGIDRPDRGSTSNAPWRTVRYALDRIEGPATLFIRTGVYQEVLPLRVPADVAVVGDELRSTQITPVENLYSLNEITIFENWITYLTTFIDNIVLKQPVTNVLGEGFQIFDDNPGTENDVSYIVERLTIFKNLMTNIDGIAITSTNIITTQPGRLSSADQIENNREFIQEEFIGYLSVNYSQYIIERNHANAIIDRILDAVIYDLKYTGNYKIVEAGKYFYFASNSIENKKQNMFLLGNATGLRNMTLTGLLGELGPINQYLTRRPTAGAYASLDPGWGPDDERAWIVARSPYVQNVTTFGTGCIGLKVDGELHNGGNKTIVANDFTQILSDGIGAWCNKDGASELVSVFTYYNHIGYLCTDGGKIRGTNGNCSYGQYGAVAESFNPDETPITAKVNNRFFDATVDQVFITAGSVRKLFFDHSGQNYTNASFTITGPGLNAQLLGDEFRDQAISESRLFAPGDSTSPGGSGYTLLINNAQIGTRNNITLAGTTDQPATALRGLRVSIETGTGAGQYGYVADYNNLNKIALIGNEFFEPYEITDSVDIGNLLVTNSTRNLKINDPVCFVGNVFGGVSANVIYYINSINPTQITVRDTFLPPASVTRSFVQADGGDTVVINYTGHPFSNGSRIEVQAGNENTEGWSRALGTGTATNTTHTVTLTSHGLVDQDTYRIEFQTGSFSAGTVVNAIVTVIDPDTFTFTGPDTGGPTENIAIRLGFRPAAGEYIVTVIDQDTITVTVTDTLYTFGDVTFSFGGNIALSDGSGSMNLIKLGWNHYQSGTEIVNVLNTTSSYRIEPRIIFSNPATENNENSIGPAIEWSDVCFGNDIFVAVAGSIGSPRDISAYSSDGKNWSTSTIPLAEWSNVESGNGLFVAVSKDGKTASSINGIDWTLNSIPDLEYTGIAYGNNTWIAVASGTSKAAKSIDGISWTEIDLGEGADWSDIAFGKGIFVAVAEGDSTTVTRAYSIDNGTSWTLGTFSGGAKSISYGNNRFVVIAGGYLGASDCYISFDGINWSVGTIPANNWQKVTYGQGKFIAVASNTDTFVESVDGIIWFSETLSVPKDYSSVTFGSPSGSPKFIAVGRLDSFIVEIVRGTRAQGRLRVSSGRATGISLWEQGSGYSSTPLVSVIDPNNSSEAIFQNRVANGVLGNPSIINQGIGYVMISTRCTIAGDGFADRYQLGNKLVIQESTRIPGPGSNLLIDGIDDYVYRVLSSTVLNGVPGDYTLLLTIAKSLQLDESPDHLTDIIIREKYSQVRLTGHDFLDIGLGNFEQTNYPDTLFPNGTVLAPEDETNEADGGRVFYTTTDQDGNFRVGELFAVEQATGTVTISAEFFQLEGLEEISLGGVTVGGTGVVIREFSTDPLFIADSNNVIPTQKAIKEFIARRISGGGSDAFTAQFTAGTVRVGPNSISTTTGEQIIIPVKVNFKKPVSGSILITSMFLAGAGNNGFMAE